MVLGRYMASPSPPVTAVVVGGALVGILSVLVARRFGSRAHVSARWFRRRSGVARAAPAGFPQSNRAVLRPPGHDESAVSTSAPPELLPTTTGASYRESARSQDAPIQDKPTVDAGATARDERILDPPASVPDEPTADLSVQEEPVPDESRPALEPSPAAGHAGPVGAISQPQPAPSTAPRLVPPRPEIIRRRRGGLVGRVRKLMSTEPGLRQVPVTRALEELTRPLGGAVGQALEQLPRVGRAASKVAHHDANGRFSDLLDQLPADGFARQRVATLVARVPLWPALPSMALPPRLRSRTRRVLRRGSSASWIASTRRMAQTLPEVVRKDYGMSAFRAYVPSVKRAVTPGIVRDLRNA